MTTTTLDLTYTRGAPATLSGITLALAFPEGVTEPDRHIFWQQTAGAWSLIDLRQICRRANLPLPAALTHHHFATAYADWLRAVAHRLATLPPPATRSSQPETRERFWWLDL